MPLILEGFVRNGHSKGGSASGKKHVPDLLQFRPSTISLSWLGWTLTLAIHFLFHSPVHALILSFDLQSFEVCYMTAIMLVVGTQCWTVHTSTNCKKLVVLWGRVSTTTPIISQWYLWWMLEDSIHCDVELLQNTPKKTASPGEASWGNATCKDPPKLDRACLSKSLWPVLAWHFLLFQSISLAIHTLISAWYARPNLSQYYFDIYETVTFTVVLVSHACLFSGVLRHPWLPSEGKVTSWSVLINVEILELPKGHIHKALYF
jgi:hypothetical protein